MPDDKTDFTLLPARMRQVAAALRTAGFDTHDFKWESVSSMSGTGELVSRLVHIPSDYYFQFDWARSSRPVRIRPGRDAWREDINFANVDDQITFFAETWTDLLGQQLAAGDPLAEFAGADDLFAEANAARNEKFSSAEVAEFTKRLEGIRTLLLERAGEDDEARHQTNERIDYLVDALKRSGKRDWFFMAFGILLERGFELALPNEQIRALLGMLARGIQQLTAGG